MQVVLEELGDKRSGVKFVIERCEADNIIVGRASQLNPKFSNEDSQLQIDKNDGYLSRWHFLLQIRKPNCFISDLGSLNHTYVNNFKKGNHIKDTVLLKEGDVIKAGRTYLRVHVVSDDVSVDEKVRCASCDSEINDDLLLTDGKAKLLCSLCQRKKEENIVEGRLPHIDILCSRCGDKLTNSTDADGRSAELIDIAQYMCERCISIERKDTPKLFGDYEILVELGKGGMGVVYKALHAKTGRLVALKMILPKTKMDKRTSLLFQREINIMKNLVHSNVVRLYEAGEFNGNLFFTSEYVAEGSVEDRILKKRKALSVEESCKIMLDVLEGLSYIHKKGYVHRDISPSNILISVSGTVKLSDMGLSKSYDLAGQSGITTSGETAGKILYMAPEQITNYRFVKPAADIYSIGIVFYYLLTGMFPYEFPTPLDMLLDFIGKKKKKEPIAIVLEDNPIPIRDRNSSIPRSIACVVDKAINKAHGRRQRSAEEMKLAILDAIA